MRQARELGVPVVLPWSNHLLEFTSPKGRSIVSHSLPKRGREVGDPHVTTPQSYHYMQESGMGATFFFFFPNLGAYISLPKCQLGSCNVDTQDSRPGFTLLFQGWVEQKGILQGQKETIPFEGEHPKPARPFPTQKSQRSGPSIPVCEEDWSRKSPQQVPS